MFCLSLPMSLRADTLILITVFRSSHLEATHKALTGPFSIVKAVSWKAFLCKNKCILYFSLTICLTQSSSSFTCCHIA